MNVYKPFIKCYYTNSVKKKYFKILKTLNLKIFVFLKFFFQVNNEFKIFKTYKLLQTQKIYMYIFI